ncbi:MAG: CorA family divalent cation transporter, partial [Pseudomonadota bacterium]
GAVTFILAKDKLVTVRQIRPRAFEIGQTRASARIGSAETGADAALALLESAVERIADILAESTHEITAFAVQIFDEKNPPPDLRASLRLLGRIGALTSGAHDSLSSLQRLAQYARHVCNRHGLDEARIGVFQRDVEELEHLSEALQTRISYLQDATLGLINSMQADVLKTLSLVTIAFAPPTLISSIFGMNFTHMTWFQEEWGPRVAFELMLFAPAVLLGVAKWRRWF